MEHAFADLPVKLSCGSSSGRACRHSILVLTRHDSLALVERCPVASI